MVEDEEHGDASSGEVTPLVIGDYEGSNETSDDHQKLERDGNFVSLCKARMAQQTLTSMKIVKTMSPSGMPLDKSSSRRRRGVVTIGKQGSGRAVLARDHFELTGPVNVSGIPDLSGVGVDRRVGL